MPDTNQQIYEALRRFAESFADKMKALAPGEPEDQLRAPLENLFAELAKILGHRIFAKGETQLPGRLGRPDYAILVGELLAGYLELKECGKGADPISYTGHDRRQWERFKAVPKIIYTDGNEWALYREG